jgi:hypothetical protein
MRTNWIKALSAAVIVTMSVLFALVAVEMYARYGKPTAYQNDKELGWKLLPNVNITFDNLRFDQTEYKALITTNELGLRESGRKDNPQLTILVLGDSFTADPVAGNEDMWYVAASRDLERLSGLEKNSIRTLAGGGSGYGKTSVPRRDSSPSQAHRIPSSATRGTGNYFYRTALT